MTAPSDTPPAPMCRHCGTTDKSALIRDTTIGQEPLIMCNSFSDCRDRRDQNASANLPEGTVVVFKDESDLDGEPIGPMTVLSPGMDTTRPYDPNSTSPQWVTRSAADTYAAGLNVPLREV